VSFWILGGGDAEPVFVIIFFIIIGIINLIRWLANKAQKAQREKQPEKQRQRQDSGGSGKGDPGEVLKRFLEEMTGKPAQQPQRAAPPPRRPDPEPAYPTPQPLTVLETQAPAHAHGPDAPEAENEVGLASSLPSEKKGARSKRPKAAPAQDAPAPSPPPKHRGPVAATEWLERLPSSPLKRAIVLREVLGPPRALQRRPQR